MSDQKRLGAIVNLRGTNGSGKSTVARALLSVGGKQASFAGVDGVVTTEGLAVVGPYKKASGGGGLDLVRTQDECQAAVRAAAAHPEATRVFFEGVLLSTLYGRWFDLSQELKAQYGVGTTWAFLDTPLTVCFARIKARGGASLKQRDLVEEKFRRMKRIHQRANDEGERAVWVDHRDPVNGVRRLLGLPEMDVDLDGMWVPGTQGELAL